MGTAPASAREALDMVQAGLGYLAAADAVNLRPRPRPSACGGWSADAIATAARAFILAGFTAGQGYADDADYSAGAWLIHQTRITRWCRRPACRLGRGATHARVLAALAAGQITESVGRLICLWTGKLRRNTGKSQMSCCWPLRPRAWGSRSWPRCSPRCTSGPAATCPTRTQAGTSPTGA